MSKLPFRRFYSRAFNYYSLYALAIALVLCLCWLLARTGFVLEPLPEADYRTYRCALEPAAGKPVLKVLDGVYLGEVQLLGALCDTRWTGGAYSGVEIHTAPRDSVDLRGIYDRFFELVLAKPEMMEQVNRTGDNYTLVAQYPNYGSSLLALGEAPRLEARWWQGRKLGLLDDPYSVSGYQLPKAALQRHDLQGVPEILYFRSHDQLYRALIAGTVDVIAGPTTEDSSADSAAPVRKLVLAEKLPGPGWYLRSDLLRTRLHCLFMQRLRELSHAAEVDYLHQLELTRPCDD